MPAPRWSLNLRNLTPYPHLPGVLWDERGREVLVVILKTSRRIMDGTPHPDPLPVHASDVRSASGAVTYPADVVPWKIGTDVVCNGVVHPPSANATSCAVELHVGDVHARIRAFGRRRWHRDGATWRISEAEPLGALPLGMERAYGGPDDPRNPVGRGHTARCDDTASGLEGRELPQLEHEEERLRIRTPDDDPAPAGFGVIAPQWEPRRSYRGTFDEVWERERAPLFPADMDARFWNAAQLVSARPLVGGEPIQLLHLSAGGRLVAELPRVPIRARVGDKEVRPSLDLVLLEPEVDRITLTFRISIDVTDRLDGRTPKIRIVEKLNIPLGGRSER